MFLLTTFLILWLNFKGWFAYSHMGTQVLFCKEMKHSFTKTKKPLGEPLRRHSFTPSDPNRLPLRPDVSSTSTLEDSTRTPFETSIYLTGKSQLNSVTSTRKLRDVVSNQTLRGTSSPLGPTPPRDVDSDQGHRL